MEQSKRLADPVRPKCLDQAYAIWLGLGVAMIAFVFVAVIVGAVLGKGADVNAPGRGGVMVLGIVIVLCARNLRRGWRGPRIVLALVAGVLLYLAASTVVGIGFAEAGATIDTIGVVAVVLAAIAAIAGTVLMFRTEANTYIRALVRR